MDPIQEQVTFIMQKLDGADYDSGALERAQETATNNSRAIAKLLIILQNKGIISKQDIEENIVNKYA